MVRPLQVRCVIFAFAHTPRSLSGGSADLALQGCEKEKESNPKEKGSNLRLTVAQDLTCLMPFSLLISYFTLSTLLLTVLFLLTPKTSPTTFNVLVSFKSVGMRLYNDLQTHPSPWKGVGPFLPQLWAYLTRVLLTSLRNSSASKHPFLKILSALSSRIALSALVSSLPVTTMIGISLVSSPVLI